MTELDVLKSKFVSDVSHELRTPIQNLKMYLDLLERGRPEKRSVYLNTLQDQVDLLKRLTEDILDLSRLELNPERGDFEDVEINQLISQVYTSLRPRAESRGLTVSVQLDPLLPMIRADAGQMVQVVNNLLENAINYTLAGSVRISTKRADNGVCLQVEDSGMGISQNDMAHLFDRFYRSNRVSQSNIRGTGLGLAIVNEIVQKHNGRIEVESEEEIGSTFRVWFPVDGVTDLRA
ncbi:MAG: HAMP domain-containing sensor histidine kinase [Caldilineaceae bacterium]